MANSEGVVYAEYDHAQDDAADWLWDNRARLLDLAARAVTLEAENADLKWQIEMVAGIGNVERARAEAAEKDAERYRWLKGQFRAFSLDMGGQHTWTLARMIKKGPTLDAAIDAAREEKFKADNELDACKVCGAPVPHYRLGEGRCSSCIIRAALDDAKAGKCE